ARGSVVDAKSMGHFKGGALLEVKLDSVTIDGKDTPVSTGMIARSIKGKGKRSATFIGGGGGAGGVGGRLAGRGEGGGVGGAGGARARRLAQQRALAQARQERHLPATKKLLCRRKPRSASS